MDHEVRKLMQFEHVDYRRAKRLIKEFGSYDDVMAASFERLKETHYIGHRTAKSIFHANRSEPNSLLWKQENRTK